MDDDDRFLIAQNLLILPNGARNLVGAQAGLLASAGPSYLCSLPPCSVLFKYVFAEGRGGGSGRRAGFGRRGEETASALLELETFLFLRAA